MTLPAPGRPAQNLPHLLPRLATRIWIAWSNTSPNRVSRQPTHRLQNMRRYPNLPFGPQYPPLHHQPARACLLLRKSATKIVRACRKQPAETLCRAATFSANRAAHLPRHVALMRCAVRAPIANRHKVEGWISDADARADRRCGDEQRRADNTLPPREYGGVHLSGETMSILAGIMSEQCKDQSRGVIIPAIPGASVWTSIPQSCRCG